MASKIGSFINSAVSAVKNVISGGNLGASAGKAMNFSVGAGLSPTQKATAQTTVTPSRSVTSGGLTTNLAGLSKLSTLPTNKSVNSGALTQAGINSGVASGGLTFSPVGLSRLSAPSSASGITGDTSVLSMLSSPSFSSSSAVNGSSSGVGSGSSTSGTSSGLGVGSTANAKAKLAGVDTLNEQQIKDAKQLELDQQQLDIQKADKENQSFLQKLFDQQQPDIQKQRVDLENQYQIQSQVAEINSLTKSLQEAELQVQNQIAQANDKLGTNNFINNQIQQIDRNSAPMLNRLRADINFKTGILTQDRQLVEQAIQDATAQTKMNWDRATQLYATNKDIIDGLRSDYKFAYNNYTDQLKVIHEDDVKAREFAADMALKYGLKNINITDDMQTVINKVSRAGFSTVASRSNGGSASGTNSNIYAQAYLDGDIDITSVPQNMRPSVLAKANEIAAAAIASSNQQAQGQQTTASAGVPLKDRMTSFGTQIIDQRKNPINYIPNPTIKGIANFFSNLSGR